MTLAFTRQDIERWIVPSYRRRGHAYFVDGRVRRFSYSNNHRLSGQVAGSRRRLYDVDIVLAHQRGEVVIEGHCSCPVAYNCKHVTAVLYEVLHHDENATAKTDGNDARLASWLTALESALEPAASPVIDDYPARERKRLLYLIDIKELPGSPIAQLDLVVAYQLKQGGFGHTNHYNLANVHQHYRPAYLLDSDVRLLKHLYLANLQSGHDAWRRLDKDDSDELLKAIVETGRAHWRDKNGPRLELGPPRQARAGWSELDEAGRQRPVVVIEPGPARLLPLPKPWYIDPASGLCGPLESETPAAFLRAWSIAPAIPPEAIPEVVERTAGLPAPAPREIEVVELPAVSPTPVARFATFGLVDIYPPFLGPPDGRRPGLVLAFDYAGRQLLFDDPTTTLIQHHGRQLQRRPRDQQAESRALDTLDRAGLTPATLTHDQKIASPDGVLLIDDTGDIDEFDGWTRFMLFELPRLRDMGWRIEIDDDFPVRIAETGRWGIEIEAAGNDWFELGLGIEIDGEYRSLLPILTTALDNLDGVLRHWRELPEDHQCLIGLDDGRILALPTARLGPLYDTLLQLFDRDQATRHYVNEAFDALDHLVQRLKRLETVSPLPAPEAFEATLRNYQEIGLGWLQALGRAGLNGVLADDMGLGKTIQTLAHIQFEKRAGRLDRPALVVAPTSLVFNWRREAEQFAPTLSVLVLHGPDRRHRFAEIPQHDLVITSYALLPRDEDTLSSQPWHLVVLDEAQHIKNPKAKAGLVARRLDARHRLCLTGTPLENHLGEFWSLFDFLMPGLLGDERQFRRLFRTPIEKYGDEARRELLARRTAPFLLRRSKETVATELPAKTEITRSIELGGPQRDLYEGIRLAMHEKVRQAIERKGLRRSHIEILDALLKLRQVCCDPRLLKIDAARKVKRSAKLEFLTQFLPELVEEGRRILLFSQFTTMLGLIEDAIGQLGIDYVKLTGRTRDRETPVARFQDGEVPVFLISLKAGGTGLNLTTADTVIHYDPWWNPAVERQATDRAHRIGQDKPVFVYRLITANTVEERIQAMQAEKQALADGLLGGASKAGLPSSDEITALFAPLE